ncbi:hypothetical protein BLOT_003106 [Blomia tropicalis]|nr:hypothetical protein BLOT_003106 [Blomia tropicalis]
MTIITPNMEQMATNFFSNNFHYDDCPLNPRNNAALPGDRKYFHIKMLSKAKTMNESVTLANVKYTKTYGLLSMYRPIMNGAKTSARPPEKVSTEPIISVTSNPLRSKNGKKLGKTLAKPAPRRIMPITNGTRLRSAKK